MPNCGATADKPVVLIMDNCSTHFSYKVIKLALDNNIHIMCKPAHTSHRVQPLDKIFFPLQDEFKSLCHKAKIVDLHSCVNKGNFTIKLDEAMKAKWTPELVKGGFRKTGIFPLCREKLPNNTLVDNELMSAPPPQFQTYGAGNITKS